MNKTGSPIQGFTVTEEVISISAFGSPLLCHPELVSGSALRETVAGGSRLVASRLEVMLPPAGSEARWREEVMPGEHSGKWCCHLRFGRIKQKREARELDPV